MKKIISFTLKWIILPLLFLLSWIYLSFGYISKNIGVSNITASYTSTNISGVPNKELLGGQIINGNFLAQDNNLGIVAVRFYNFQRINSDSVIFRIKEQSQKNWFYQNTYKVDQFQPNKLFTFGFPIQFHSQGKTYEFQIESMKGQPGDAIALSMNEPIFVTTYQFDTHTLRTNREELLRFVKDKIRNLLDNTNFVIISFIYLFPLLFYIFWVLIADVFFTKQYFFAVIPWFAMLLTVFLSTDVTPIILLTLIAVWIYIIFFYKFEGKISFLGAIFFLIVMCMFILFNKQTQANNAAIYVYCFLVVGVIQQIIELKYGNEQLITYEDLNKMYIKKFFKSPRKS